MARVDRRTKDLAKRILPGQIAVIDHEDLDTVATESLIAAGITAVVNASASISGRYPNAGPLLLPVAGVAVLDGVGSQILATVADGDLISVEGDRVLRAGEVVGQGARQDIATFGAVLETARSSMGDELQRFAENTLNYIQREGHLLIDEPDIPEIPVDFKGRQVLVAVRGVDYKQDLELLRRSGYLKEQRPLLVGVDGGADAFLEMHMQPDVIIGDMDSVSEQALRSGAALVVHGYTDGRAPGAALLDELGVDYAVFASAGTSEDIAMLMAFERGAELIVAVGTHSSMVDFLDKGRPGMASTFLVRLKVGPILVDAKGVSRLYTTHVSTRDLLPLVLAAIITMIIIGALSEPIRTVVRGLALPLR
ncbi:putative cytokinetic ring protein SteA [Iamia sp.]|uniref:putative cytokinetic ring protein SteA n=1 Tax=Iamia sp. TaxID=2722710 RepID=UPI002C7EDA2F|nr:putative cytokinetic ring protein SteA [Iamia sp.]HXH59064.1 putative cytokinetic ring protein SteA [Iamia sp.]